MHSVGIFVDVHHEFTTSACGQSEITKGMAVCFVVEGHRSKINKKITGSASLMINDTSVFNFGSFSFNYQGAKADGLMNASPPKATQFLKLFHTVEKRLLIKERFLTKNNIPRMDEEIL